MSLSSSLTSPNLVRRNSNPTVNYKHQNPLNLPRSNSVPNNIMFFEATFTQFPSVHSNASSNQTQIVDDPVRVSSKQTMDSSKQTPENNVEITINPFELGPLSKMNPISSPRIQRTLGISNLPNFSDTTSDAAFTLMVDEDEIPNNLGAPVRPSGILDEPALNLDIFAASVSSIPHALIRIYGSELDSNYIMCSTAGVSILVYTASLLANQCAQKSSTGNRREELNEKIRTIFTFSNYLNFSLDTSARVIGCISSGNLSPASPGSIAMYAATAIPIPIAWAMTKYETVQNPSLPLIAFKHLASSLAIGAAVGSVATTLNVFGVDTEASLNPRNILISQGIGFVGLCASQFIFSGQANFAKIPKFFAILSTQLSTKINFFAQSIKTGKKAAITVNAINFGISTTINVFSIIKRDTLKIFTQRS